MSVCEHPWAWGVVEHNCLSSWGRLDQSVYFSSSLVFVNFFTIFIITELKLKVCVCFQWVSMSEFIPAFYGYWQALSHLSSLVSIFINITLDWVFRVRNSEATSIFKCVENLFCQPRTWNLRLLFQKLMNRTGHFWSIWDPYQHTRGTGVHVHRTMWVRLRGYDFGTWWFLLQAVRCLSPFTNTVGSETQHHVHSLVTSSDCTLFLGLLPGVAFWFSLSLPVGTRFLWFLSLLPTFQTDGMLLFSPSVQLRILPKGSFIMFVNPGSELFLMKLLCRWCILETLNK